MVSYLLARALDAEKDKGKRGRSSCFNIYFFIIVETQVKYKRKGRYDH